MTSEIIMRRSLWTPRVNVAVELESCKITFP